MMVAKTVSKIKNVPLFWQRDSAKTDVFRCQFDRMAYPSKTKSGETFVNRPNGRDRATGFSGMPLEDRRDKIIQSIISFTGEVRFPAEEFFTLIRRALKWQEK